ncbi:MAG: biotin/lipoyl-binding protein [Paludibacter sp.]|nr:biotin/lipoyl-binding protein [Paludibacter sp.]
MKKFKFKIDGSEYEVSVNEIDKNIAEIEVNGTPFTVEIERQEKSVLSINRKPAGKVNPVTTPTRLVSASSIKSPLPGVIVKVLVQPGDTVKRGDVLLTMESMKMENNILAEEDTVIKTVYVQPGQSVLQDDILIDFECTASAVQARVSVPDSASVIPPAPKTAATITVKSPLPGSVIKVYVTVGQSIKRGDTLLTLESMKMENNILSEKSGVIKAIHVVAGQTVMQEDALVDME